MLTLARVILVSLLACAVGWGQATSTAQISGTVRDSTGLAVPGAEVKATQTATGAVRTATSGADGSYVLPNLPIGPYQFEVSKDGFTKYVQSNIILQVNGNPTLDAVLKVPPRQSTNRYGDAVSRLSRKSDQANPTELQAPSSLTRSAVH